MQKNTFEDMFISRTLFLLLCPFAISRSYLSPFTTRIGGLRLMMGTTAGSAASASSYPLLADESIMSAKAHGTCVAPVQRKLRYRHGSGVVCIGSTGADEFCCSS